MSGRAWACLVTSPIRRFEQHLGDNLAALELKTFDRISN